MATKPKLGIPVNAGPLVFLDDNPDDYIGERYIQPVAPAAPAPEETSTLRRVVGDGAVTALKGAIGVPEAAVGLADIVTGGNVGKALENEGGTIGFRPKQAKEYLDQFYSPAQQAANRAVQEAANPEDSLPKRILDTGVAAVRNPSTIVHAVGESLPSMAAGGVLARGAMAVAPRMSAFAAAGVGEGVVAAGSSASQIRQQTPDGLLTPGQAAIAAGSGAMTAGLGIVAGKVAKSLGIGDIDTMIAGGGGATPQMQKGFVRKLLEGAFTEGVLEELPQSVQEQVAQNYALGKPLDEGVDQAAVMGLLSGGLMGAGAANIGRPAVPEVGPLSRAANQAPMPGVAPVAPNAPEAPEAAAAPLAPTVALAPEQEKQLLDTANQRLAEIDQKAKGTKEKKKGDKIVAPEVPAQLLTPEETKERDFLQQAGGDAQALARMFGAPEVPSPEPQPVSDPAAVAQRSADRPALPTELPRDGDILNGIGKPFTTMPGAMTALRKAGEGFEIVPVLNGKRAGLVVRRKAGDEQTQEAPQPSVVAADPGPEPGAEPAGSGGDRQADAQAPGGVDGETAGEPSGRSSAPEPVADAGEGAAAVAAATEQLSESQNAGDTYTGATMAEMDALKDVPTTEIMREAVALVGEEAFQQRAEQRIKEVNRNGKWNFPESAIIEGTARDIVAVGRREEQAPDMGNPMSEDVPPASDAAPSDGAVRIPPEVDAALTEDMARQQARMKRLRTAAESPDLSLADKLAAQTKAKAAEATLAKMRRTRFDAEDAIAAGQDFAPHADIFPRAAAVLQASVAPAASAPSGNSSTPAPLDIQPGDILNTANGKPFKNMSGAMDAQREAGDDYEIKRVRSGLVVRRKEGAAPAEKFYPSISDAEAARKAAGQDTHVIEHTRRGLVVRPKPAPAAEDPPFPNAITRARTAKQKEAPAEKPATDEPAKPTTAEIALRKRVSVLHSLLECMS